MAKESTAIGQSDEIEFVSIVRAGSKESGSAPERSHSVEGARRKVSLPRTPKLKRVLHGAAARSTINQILADTESNDGDPMRSHTASPDESPSSIRLQAPRWGNIQLVAKRYAKRFFANSNHTVLSSLDALSSWGTSHEFPCTKHESTWGYYSAWLICGTWARSSAWLSSFNRVRILRKAWSSSFEKPYVCASPPSTLECRNGDRIRAPTSGWRQAVMT
jgi:hypothetical protein